MGALIYREIQLRKAEATAAAAESKKISTGSTKLRTSTRIRSLSTNHDMKSLSRPQRKSPSKRKRETSLEEDQPRRGKEVNALLMVAQIMLKKEEHAIDMGQRGRSTDMNALLKDVQIML